MTTTAMSAAQLLQVSEPEFDTAVQAMTLKVRLRWKPWQHKLYISSVQQNFKLYIMENDLVDNFDLVVTATKILSPCFFQPTDISFHLKVFVGNRAKE